VSNTDICGMSVQGTDRPPQLPTDRVAAELRARITASEWAADEQLPSAATLAGQHNTSRATMSRAIQRLADEGLLRVVPSWGTFRT
jgi:DNA-binding GntR family transcriptional regulator